MKSFDFGVIAIAVIAIVGCIQWIKGWIASIFPKLAIPSWAWSLLMALACVAVAIFALGLTGGYVILGALLLIAVCELGYAIIVQSFSGLVQGLLNLVVPGGGSPPSAK